MKYSLLVLLCVCGITSTAIGSDSCAQTSYGKCFSIRARFAVYTGNGMEELWPVGTHRLLWVASGTDQLNAVLGDNPDDFLIFGDFVVCPLRKNIAGEMRHVCIKRAQNLRRVRRKPAD